MTEIVLGCNAKDRITGMVGIVTSRMFRVGEMIRYGVSPGIDKAKPTEIADAVGFDEVSLEYVDAGISALAQPLPTDVKIKLGEAVEHTVTGYAGIAMVRYDDFNGCVYFTVQGKPKKGDLPPKPQMFPHFLLKRTGVGISKSLPKEPVVKSSETAVVRRPPGGQPERLERR